MPQFQIGELQIGRVAEIEFPAFRALEFFPAATPDQVTEAARAMPGRIVSLDGVVEQPVFQQVGVVVI